MWLRGVVLRKQPPSPGPRVRDGRFGGGIRAAAPPLGQPPEGGMLLACGDVDFSENLDIRYVLFGFQEEVDGFR